MLLEGHAPRSKDIRLIMKFFILPFLFHSPISVISSLTSISLIFCLTTVYPSVLNRVFLLSSFIFMFNTSSHMLSSFLILLSLLIPVLIPLSRVGTTSFASCYDKDSAIILKLQLSPNFKAVPFPTDDDWEVPFDVITDMVYLGSGAQGVVFGGNRRGEMVAVKKLREKSETNIKHLRKLNHENIGRKFVIYVANKMRFRIHIIFNLGQFISY
jgi:hypothetical protein